MELEKITLTLGAVSFPTIELCAGPLAAGFCILSSPNARLMQHEKLEETARQEHTPRYSTLKV
jgi:hypothetical protein